MPITGNLYPFQEEGVDRMVERGQLLVGFDMGLGKTFCGIAAAERIMDAGEGEGCLVLTLNSLKFQWEKEINKFAPEASVLIINGDPKKRQKQYASAPNFDYVIATYDQVVNDWELLRPIRFDIIIADEINAIKNPTAKRSRRVKRLKTPFRFGLTGTPVENRPEELYSILQWIDPEVLGRFDLFDKTYIVRDPWGKVLRYRNLDTLRTKLGDVMIRRTHAEVADQLPSVVNEVREIEFDAASARLYKTMVTELLEDLAMAAQQGHGGFNLYSHYHGGDEEDNMWRGKIMAKVTCLRLLCDHPELLRISAARFLDENIDGGSSYAAELDERGLLKVESSPKFDEAMDIIEEVVQSPENKVVLFSFFTPTLRLLESALREKGIGVVQFHGRMNAKQREEAKVSFQTDPDVKVFLSSDAGGVGVDLPQGNYLINFDLPWSAGKYAQRNARIVRLSSTFKSVTVINLLMQGSVDVLQHNVLTRKAAISKAWIDGEGVDDKGEMTLDTQSLSSFLHTSSV